MELEEDARKLTEQLGAAINRAIERSFEVADAIEKLREAGYEVELQLRLDIGLRPHRGAKKGEFELELTDEDRRTLRQMKIRLDDLED
ncbi:hypothetical protein [Pyrinomonas methylaliphatogenes]|uniref:Uncharacterized protein n=1 Tax=Pyrinomonas methylaliphatogenes TaxID=454194 RepID=A0A0B6X059_9BACT|nr:hypothetical protein [Pyrinomonas methylaliphatogenes]MBX5478066.1 hypothetical protein [Pyrinomonas methylaliphatogenes]CDM66913.1 hypothetical protein PYK22_02954 [Pyrinomonas methylaliphatogenes]